MVRNDLLDNGYHFEQKQPKRWITAILRMFLSIFFIAVSSLLFVLKVILDAENIDAEISNGIVGLIIIIAIPLAYFFLKSRITSLFCCDKKQCIVFKVLENGEIVCTCREALKIWQIILIYSVPAVLTYSISCVIIMLMPFDSFYVFLLLIMSFIMSHDLALVIYILFMKAKYNADYISVNKHIYNLTLYTKSTLERV